MAHDLPVGIYLPERPSKEPFGALLSRSFAECIAAMKSIYVGNLPFTATEDEIRDLFAAYGEVDSVRLVNDRDTGRPRGFGFVTMDDASADAAIKALDGQQMGGRSLRINEAQPRPERPRYGRRA